MLKKILCGASLLCAASFSNAAVIVQDFTVDRQSTDFSEIINFNLFNDQNGTLELESVEFTLFARSSGLARVENRNANSTRITATLSTDIRLLDSVSALLVSAAPSTSRSDTLDAFDGLSDFAGPSGVEFLNLSTNDFDDVILIDAASLMAYTGMGTGSVNFVAKATSEIDGGGNLTSEILTFASGDVSVIYTFSEVTKEVSAPTHVALLGLGLLAFAGMRKAKS